MKNNKNVPYVIDVGGIRVSGPSKSAYTFFQ